MGAIVFKPERKGGPFSEGTKAFGKGGVPTRTLHKGRDDW